MSKPKEEQNSYDVCYNLPTALSIPFQTADITNYHAYEYKFTIPDISLEFTVITPVYIGDLFDVAQKSILDLDNGDKKIIRQKVVRTSMTQIQLSQERLFLLQSSNNKFFQALNPSWEKSMAIFTEAKLSEGDISVGGYGILRKQYLISNHFIEDNFSFENADLQNDGRPLTYQEIRGNLDYVYLNTKEIEHCFVIHSFDGLKKLSLHDFAKELFEALFPKNKPEVSNPYKDLNSFMMTELELKKEDLASIGDPGSFKEFSVAMTNRKTAKDLAKVVRGINWDKITSFDDSCLCLTVPATAFGQFDNNKYEGVERYVSNVSIRKVKTRDYTKVSLVLSSSLKRTPFKAEDLDKYLRIVPTLIQIERMAQVREFKLLMHFGFIKDHLLFKALNARAIDRCCNNETLETLGDTVLKTLATINLFFYRDAAGGKLNPDQMTKQKVMVINNNHLAAKGRSTPLLFYLKDKYQRTKDYIPPYFLPKAPKIKDEEKSDSHIYDESQIIADGMIADSVEAIIGNMVLLRRHFGEH